MPPSRMFSFLSSLAFVLLASVPVIAGEDATLILGWPLVSNAIGDAAYGTNTWNQQQSAKAELSAGLEYRHWFSEHSGIQFDYNRTGTDATFTSLSFNASLNYRVTRHEISGAFVRKLSRPETRLRPFFVAGPGVLLFDGGYALGNKVGWASAPEFVFGGGIDTSITKRLSVRTAFRFHLFRNPNFGDPNFHPGFAHMQQPVIGLTSSF